MTSSDGYIFLSYSRKDTDFQKRAVAYLRGKGLNIWVDNEKLIPGTPIWETEIEKAITGASAILVLLSPDSKNSEWVRREITLAEQTHKRIFPVLVRGDEDSSIPLRLITCQHVDLRKNEKTGLLALYNSLNGYLVVLAEQKAAAQMVDRAKAEASEREAAEKFTREKAAQEAKEKAAREKVERDAAQKAAREQAKRDAAEKSAREKEERAATKRTAWTGSQFKRQILKFWKANQRYILGGLGLFLMVILALVIVPHLSFGKSPEIEVTGTPALTETLAVSRTITPSKTQTLTLTETHTPTVMPTTSGKLVFEKNFEQDSIQTVQADGSDYAIVDDGSGNKAIMLDGFGQFDSGYMFQQGTIEFRIMAQNISGPKYSWSLLFGGEYGGVNLEISPSGNRWSIFSTLSSEVIGSDSYTFGKSEWNTIRIWSDGSSVSLFLNGELCWDGLIDNAFYGYLGFSTQFGCDSSYACPTPDEVSGQFYIDDIQVWMP